MSTETIINGTVLSQVGVKSETNPASVSGNETGNQPQAAAPATESSGPTGNSSSTARTVALQSMLYRHPTEKLAGGVCGGLANYLGWDASLVRILWVMATLFTSGGGFLAYLALWMLLPVGTVEGGQLKPAAIELNQRNFGLAAKVLIGVGVLWLLANVGILPFLWGGFWGVMRLFFWPALLIGIGYLLLGGRDTFKWQGNNWRAGWNNNWSSGWNKARSDFSSQVGEKVPSGASLKASLSELRQRIPLKRARRDKMLLGVCGGLAKQTGVDANIIRLIWVAFSFMSAGTGALIYALVGFILPEEELPYGNGKSPETQTIKVVDGSVTVM